MVLWPGWSAAEAALVEGAENGVGSVGSGAVMAGVRRVPGVTVALDRPVSVSVTPSEATLPINDTRSFTATVTGTSDTRVTWSATCGAISGSGNTVTYTAPGSAGTCTVSAASVAASSAVGSATVTVSASCQATRRST